MWAKRTRPEDLIIPDDIHEARAIRADADAELHEVHQQAPFVRRISAGLIDRQGKNHYIELLYQRLPKGA